ncbi:unnamed protein product, partial [Ranitomeya imitator]
MDVAVRSSASYLHQMTSSSCLHAAAPAQVYFVCPVEGRAKADKVHLRRSRSVKTRRGRHRKKMGGPGPRRPSYRDRPWIYEPDLMFQSLEHVFALQKGQHLEPFIMNFINSCESPKPKPSRPELTILSPTSENDKKLFNDLYKNNANRSENIERKHNLNCFMEVMTVEGVYDYLMYIVPIMLCKQLMRESGTAFLSVGFLSLMGGSLLRGAVMGSEKYHDRALPVFVFFVDAVFCETTEPRAVSAKQKRAKQTFEEMMAYIPVCPSSCTLDLIGKCIGEEAKYEGIRLLFDGLQQPVLNKQLSYVLLDIVILDIFPELGK